MFGIKRKKLTEEQLSNVEHLGEKVGRVLFKRNFIDNANDYVTKHRFVALPIIVLVALCVTISGFFIGSKDYFYNPAPELPLSPQNDVPAYDGLLDEYRTRVDSVQYLLERGNLTLEDSVYVATSLEYINNIKQ